jgi:hypothetical protein
MLILNPNLFYHLEGNRKFSLKINPLINLASMSSIKKLLCYAIEESNGKKGVAPILF